MLLEELGVIEGVSSMGYTHNRESIPREDGEYIHFFACRDRGLIAKTNDSKKATGLGMYRLTRVGINLMSLIDISK